MFQIDWFLSIPLTIYVVGGFCYLFYKEVIKGE